MRAKRQRNGARGGGLVGAARKPPAVASCPAAGGRKGRGRGGGAGGRFMVMLCDLVRASSGRNELISHLPGRGGCLGGPSNKWGGQGRPAGHTAARSGGARVRFPWPAVAHVRFGWATSRRSGGTILRGCARGLTVIGSVRPFG
jgi:hypothetical protein